MWTKTWTSTLLPFFPSRFTYLNSYKVPRHEIYFYVLKFLKQEMCIFKSTEIHFRSKKSDNFQHFCMCFFSHIATRSWCCGMLLIKTILEAASLGMFDYKFCTNQQIMPFKMSFKDWTTLELLKWTHKQCVMDTTQRG